MTAQTAKRWSLALGCLPLTACAAFFTAVASVPAGDGLWGRVCVGLMWYVFCVGGYLAWPVGLAGASLALWAARRAGAGRCRIGYGLLAAAHLLAAWGASLLFDALMSV